MIRVLISSLVLAPLLAGCGSSATTETPAEIPPAPKESSKDSYQALFKKGSPPAPAAPK
jgi:hypothetical protein